jgi:hypothetical protein
MSKLDNVAENWSTSEDSISPAKGTGSWRASGVFWSGVRGRVQLDVLPGRELAGSAVGKIVNDFGCGLGHETIELAKYGPHTVIGQSSEKTFCRFQVLTRELREYLRFLNSGRQLTVTAPSRRVTQLRKSTS